MDTNTSNSSALSPFLEEIRATFLGLIRLYGGIPNTHQELIRKSKDPVAISTFYRWHNACERKTELISLGHVGPILEAIIILTKRDDDRENFQQKLADALLKSG